MMGPHQGLHAHEHKSTSIKIRLSLWPARAGTSGLGCSVNDSNYGLLERRGGVAAEHAKKTGACLGPQEWSLSKAESRDRGRRRCRIERVRRAPVVTPLASTPLRSAPALAVCAESRHRGSSMANSRYAMRGGPWRRRAAQRA